MNWPKWTTTNTPCSRKCWTTWACGRNSAAQCLRWSSLPSSRSVDEHGVVRRLWRNLDGERLDGSTGDHCPGVRRALRDDDDRAGLELLALIADPHRTRALYDVLDLVGVGMHVLLHVARLNLQRCIVGG